MRKLFLKEEGQMLMTIIIPGYADYGVNGNVSPVEFNPMIE